MDFIIVGQGLAGSVLALMLIDKGYKIAVIDTPELSLCSKVGGGGINPVVFKRLTKSWMADEILPAMHNFYSKCEKKFGCKLVVKRNLVKLFSEKQEADLWIKKASGELFNFLENKIYSSSEFKGITIGDAGYSKVKNAAGFIMADFLAGAKKQIEEHGLLINEKFEFSELKLEKDITYKDLKADKIIFAEGYLLKSNPLFNYIPLKPVKGEILTFVTDEIEIGENIIKKNAFLTNIYGNVYKTGTTYNWDSINDEPTEEGREEIEKKLSKITSAAFTIINHEAGVRPSGIDRRPILGSHPQQASVFVFNGLGAKGVMLAPYFANQLIQHIAENEPLNPEVDVTRFKKFFVN